MWRFGKFTCMLLLLLLLSQNSQIPFKTGSFTMALHLCRQESIDRKEKWTKQSTLCVCLCVCVRMCVHMWVYLGKWDESFSIYVCGYILKIQCFDQKYCSHIEYGKFSLWFVAMGTVWLFVELVFIFRCIFVSRNDTSTKTLPITLW